MQTEPGFCLKKPEGGQSGVSGMFKILVVLIMPSHGDRASHPFPLQTTKRGPDRPALADNLPDEDCYRAFFNQKGITSFIGVAMRLVSSMRGRAGSAGLEGS